MKKFEIRIMKLKRSGYSNRRIALLMNKEGLTTGSGSKWSTKAVSNCCSRLRRNGLAIPRTRPKANEPTRALNDIPTPEKCKCAPVQHEEPESTMMKILQFNIPAGIKLELLSVLGKNLADH